MKINQQVIAADTKYGIEVPPGLVTFDIHNDSPFNMAINLGSDSGLDDAEYYMSPHSILYGISSENSGPGYSVGGSRGATQIFVYTQTPLGGSIAPGSAPAQSLTVMGYPVGRAPQSTVSLNRIANLGNPGGVQVSQTVANQIVDTSNATGEMTIRAAVAGDAQDSVQIFNNGNANFGNPTRQGVVQMALGEVLRFILHSGGTASMDLYGDSASSELRLTGVGQKTFRLFSNQTPNADIVFDYSNGYINASTPGIQVTGTVGTATLYMSHTGTQKIVVLVENGYRNGGATAQTITLPVPFSTSFRWWTGDTNPMTFVKAGASVNVGVVTALAAAGGSVTVQTGVNKYSFGDGFSAIDTISFNSGEASAHTGITVLIGN